MARVNLRSDDLVAECSCGYAVSARELASSLDCPNCGASLVPLGEHIKAPRAAKSTTLGGNQSKAHTALVRAIRLALGDEPDLVLWPMQPVGKPDSDTGRPLRGGPVGMADLCGILAPRGRWFCLEVKTGRASQSSRQKAWEAIVLRHGGYYAVVRSVEDAWGALWEARG